MIHYIVLFIIFSIIGWFIDSAYRSIIDKKGASRIITYSFFSSPLYGIGGLSLVLLFTYLRTNFIIQILLATIILTFIEFLGGLFYTHIFKRRLWDYSKNRFNFLGHIDLLHSFYWLILSILMRIFLSYLELI